MSSFCLWFAFLVGAVFAVGVLLFMDPLLRLTLAEELLREEPELLRLTLEDEELQRHYSEAAKERALTYTPDRYRQALTDTLTDILENRVL